MNASWCAFQQWSPLWCCARDARAVHEEAKELYKHWTLWCQTETCVCARARPAASENRYSPVRCISTMRPEERSGSSSDLRCVLCHREDETRTTGPLSCKHGIAAHQNCLVRPGQVLYMFYMYLHGLYDCIHTHMCIYMCVCVHIYTPTQVCVCVFYIVLPVFDRNN